jgi:hypothetical protein
MEPTQPLDNENRQDFFEQHLKSMSRFRASHIPIKNDITNEVIDGDFKELNELSPTLLSLGYVLSTIVERGNILLPKNWQN